MKPDLRVAARTLALDLATGEVVRGLADAGIDCMVLRGPPIKRRLYGDVPGCRNYGDIDLLVAPRHFDACGLVLASAHAWLNGDRVDPGVMELCGFPAATARPDLLRRGA